MKKINEKLYEEYLVTLANTRLIYNKISDLESFLETNTIHSNGIKRCFRTTSKMRSAFRDIQGEVLSMTNNMVNLLDFLPEYKKASDFIRDRLSRRKNLEDFAREFISWYLGKLSDKELSASKLKVFQEILEQEVEPVIFFLILMKILPGYDSKNGDVADFDNMYENVLMVLEGCVSNSIFERHPLFHRALDFPDKSRIMLYFFCHQIVENHKMLLDKKNFYQNIADYKQSLFEPIHEGFYNTHNGFLKSTEFYFIEHAANFGTYFLHKYEKKDGKLLRQSQQLSVYLDGDKIIVYFNAADFFQQLLQEKPLLDKHHAWYFVAVEDFNYKQISLNRMFHSNEWPGSFQFTLCEKPEVVQQYEFWLENSIIENKFEQFHSDFYISLHAITKEHLYIRTEKEGFFYKVPKSSLGEYNFNINDNIGIVKMNGETYLAFDELLLYFKTSRANLKKYQIEVVSEIK